MKESPPVFVCTHTPPFPRPPHPPLTTVQKIKGPQHPKAQSVIPASLLHCRPTSYSRWIWLGWLPETPAIWLPITSQSIKWSVKLTDVMTCQDCSPYMRSEETVLHRATAHGRLSVLCMPLSGAGTVHEKHHGSCCVAVGLSVHFSGRMRHNHGGGNTVLVPGLSSHAVIGKAMLEGVSVFYRAAGSWSVCAQIPLFTPLWPPFGCSVRWRAAGYIFSPIQYCANGWTFLQKPTQEQHDSSGDGHLAQQHTLAVVLLQDCAWLCAHGTKNDHINTNLLSFSFP